MSWVTAMRLVLSNERVGMWFPRGHWGRGGVSRLTGLTAGERRRSRFAAGSTADGAKWVS